MYETCHVIAVMCLAWGFGLALVFRIIPATPDAVLAAVDAARDVHAFLFPASRHRKTGATHA